MSSEKDERLAKQLGADLIATKKENAKTNQEALRYHKAINFRRMVLKANEFEL